MLELIMEYELVNSTLYEKYIDARIDKKTRKGRKIFLSYSSKDKHFARMLTDDLRLEGHIPWLDEWEIKVGESIPKKISDGIGKSDFLVVVLSNNSVKSMWVENEWQSKYYDEIKNRKVMILPILLEKCKIPNLLKAKKYADFTINYSEGLENLLKALK